MRKLILDAYPPKLVYIGLGSNLGDPVRTLQAAMSRLEERSLERPARSSIWETTPVNCPPGSTAFANAVIGLVPRLEETPETLLRALQDCEREFGRMPKKILNEARPLDLDILMFGEARRSSAELILPHPRAHERRFVLQPLCEIAPDLVLPGQTLSVAELLELLPPDPGMRRLQSGY